VGYLGSLFPWSGLEGLVEASPQVAAQVPDVLFVIGGGQPELRAALERRIRELGMEDRFHFAGDVPWSRAAEFISAFDVAVAPAKFADGRSGISPQKVYAYLACERPVVGSDLKGLGDVLTAHRVGLSFPSGDRAALAQAVTQLLQNREAAAEMGRRGRALVLERFTWEQVVRRTMTICEEVARKQRSARYSDEVSDTSQSGKSV
jgi:glycosyltransferase involved in cell wall biosynthesis